MYAIAIDLGTTTLAASLINTISGERLATTGALNPQRCFGADVVSRLDAAINSVEAGRKMTGVIRDELHRLVRELCAISAVSPSDVKQIAIAGNPAMQHFLLDLPVKKLAFPPYRPVITSGTHLAIAELGWEGNAEVYLFPMPGGFVGGDTVAFLFGALSSQANPSQEVGWTYPLPPYSLPLSPSLYLDMGTNGEIVLLAGEEYLGHIGGGRPRF